MSSLDITIIKRDGKEERFSEEKISRAIGKAFVAAGRGEEDDLINHLTNEVTSRLSKNIVSVEEIQDLVEKALMNHAPEIAKKYIIYREWRNRERHRKTKLKQIMDGIVTIDANDVNLSNANMSSHTPAGQMMTFASEVTKDYTFKYLLAKQDAEAHLLGDIHIHDLDYYPTKTTTCVQYDLKDLFERGFHTKNGSIRTPQSIQSYATLATIVFQTNQNEQHGGQAIPAFDFFMADGVRKTYIKHLRTNLSFVLSMLSHQVDDTCLREKFAPINCPIQQGQSILENVLEELDLHLSQENIQLILDKSLEMTRKDTHQAMEGFIHNLNTMHSRGGNQVVFSSINYGTDTSEEGRMVIRELLKATIEGLGISGEVPVFPIQIFKVKDGVSYSKEDMNLAMDNFEAAEKGELTYKTPNFDLLIEACKTTAKALFPNFLFLDTPYNQNDLWKEDDPKRYLYEIATMGCRTRVFENIAGEKSSVGRGNLSFTTMNLPRLAIEARRKAEQLTCEENNENEITQKAKKFFFESVREISVRIAEQLYRRYEYQRTAYARQFPFMMSNNVWKGGGKLEPNQQVNDILRSGTLGIGFIGGHNAMVALLGKGHGESQESWQTLYEAVMIMNEVANEYKEKYQLNYSVLATPAEGLSGRFTKIDRKKYGLIHGVNDKDYYVNSFHIDVCEEITILEKIKKEAPFHAITGGGHISYVELDGEAKKNVRAICKIVQAMYNEQIGYGSINHPIDTCNTCGYKGVIYSKCPLCNSNDIKRMRRITGYLTGDLASWNSAKKAEEKDRVKHC